jgi:hypothetical protein
MLQKDLTCGLLRVDADTIFFQTKNNMSELSRPKTNPVQATPFVMIALVAAGTLNSSAENFNTAVNGVSSGTLTLKRVRSRMTNQRHHT